MACRVRCTPARQPRRMWRSSPASSLHGPTCALRCENARSGRAGWVPAVRGGWRKGVPAAEREYLPLTEEVVTAQLSGELELGLYPLLDGDRCHGWAPTSKAPPPCSMRSPTSG